MALLFYKIKNYYAYRNLKKSATFSGSLVFFALLGLVPTAYLFSLTLSVFGKELSVFNSFFITKEFEGIKTFIFDSAKNIGAGGNVIAGFISIYSATNLFVHLKITGEVIYSKKSIGGLKIRILSIIASIIICLILSLSLTIFTLLYDLIAIKLGTLLASVINVTLLLCVLFLGVLLINFFVCPFKTGIKTIIFGSLYTIIFGTLFTVIFLIYIRFFSSYDKIYGKVAVIPMFFAWLFIVFRCLVDGFIINSYRIKQSNG